MNLSTTLMNARAAATFFLPPAISLGCLLALSGCSLPQPQPDPTRFYVLSTDAMRANPRPDAPSLHLRDVEIANYLRTRPLVIRRGENEIEFRDFALWGEPLETGIARVLREELLARGAARTVTSSARREHGNHLELSVRVLACEGGPNGDVAFRAVWEITTTGPKAGAIAGGDYRPAGLKWDGKSEASLAAQLSQAVVGLAGEIAAAMPRPEPTMQLPANHANLPE